MEVTKQKQQLLNLDAFEEILSEYKPSQSTIEILASIPLVLLVGPTAAGRNTLINLLVETERYYSIISNTTRKPRSNNGIMERDGVEYWFKTEDEFLEGLRQGKYLEAAVIHKQQVSGINIEQLEAATQAHKIAINEVEIAGAAYVHELKQDTLCIFLLPPSFSVWMQRIRDRGDVDDAELIRRLESAVIEITTALHKDYYQFVVNYEIHEAAQAVDELAQGRPINPHKQQIGRDHAEQLLVDVEHYLQNL